jgi:hypothetical protein
MQRTEKQDIYTRITNQIVSHLEKGVRPSVRPGNAEHAAGRITRPLRHNGKPYSGINVGAKDRIGPQPPGNISVPPYDGEVLYAFNWKSNTWDSIYFKFCHSGESPGRAGWA